MGTERYQLFLNKSTLSTEDVPMLISKEQQDLIFAGDTEPYFITQEIDYSALANGIEYRTEFFKSFISKLKETVIAGSRDGHQTWSEAGAKRANNDLYMIGGKVDHINSKAYFKNYIPKTGESGDNSEFIKNAKLGLINFSLVTYAKLNVEVDQSTGEEKYYITESIRGERNDAVGRMEGAMAQEIIQNQKQEKITMPADIKKTLITQVNNALTAGTLSVTDIIPENRLINSDIETRVDVVNKLCKNYDLKPEELVEKFKNLNDKIIELSKDALLAEAFGPEKLSNGKLNRCRSVAAGMVGKEIKTETELKNRIEELKKEEVIIQLNKENADPNHVQNVTPGKGAEDKKENAQGNEDAPWRNSTVMV